MTLHPARFELGCIVATPGALARAKEHGLSLAELLSRHLVGDWGDLGADDRRENELAVKRGDLRIFSSYGVGDRKLWVITEADRSSTCVLCPEEY